MLIFLFKGWKVKYSELITWRCRREEGSCRWQWRAAGSTWTTYWWWRPSLWTHTTHTHAHEESSACDWTEACFQVAARCADTHVCMHVECCCLTPPQPPPPPQSSPPPPPPDFLFLWAPHKAQSPLKNLLGTK